MNAVSPAPTSRGTSSRVLVTGATGFIGRNLVDALLAAGTPVSLVVLPGTEAWCHERWGGRLDVLVHDGSSQHLRELVRTTHPAIVYHLASLFLAQHTPDDIAPLITSNVLFGTQLLDAMAECGVPHLVNAGTSWQHYGQHYDQANASTDYAPVNLYAASKQAFEAMLRYYTAAHGIKATTLKLFDTYGPHDPRPKLIRLLHQSQTATEPLALSPGEQVLDLLYIDDVVAAFLHAGQRIGQQADAQCAYGLPSGGRVTLRELVACIDEVTGTPCRIAWGARPYRPREVMQPWPGQPVLPGWAPRVGLREGLRRTLLESPSELTPS